jgi:serine protease Do
VGLASPGHQTKVKVWRDGGERTLEVKIGETPDEREAQQRGSSRGGAPTVLGLEVRPITPDVARQLNLRTSEGVIVARVDEGSAAADAGIQRGDVVREINRQKIRNTADYERITRDTKDGDRLTVLLQRGPMSLYVAFTVGRG